MNDKKQSRACLLTGNPIPAISAEFPLIELRALVKDVQSQNHLRGALREINGRWIVGMKCPTRILAQSPLKYLTYRWDGNFGSAFTLTAGERNEGWVARAWVWLAHASITQFRQSKEITVLTVYSNEPVSVVKLRSIDGAQEDNLIRSMLPLSSEAPILIAEDEELSYWETFGNSPSWDKLMRLQDFLQTGWLKALRSILLPLTKYHEVLRRPDLTEDDRSHWNEGPVQCPDAFWEGTVLPLVRALQGKVSLLSFIRQHRPEDLLLVVSDETTRRDLNPLTDYRLEIGMLIDAALLSDTQTDLGLKVGFLSFTNNEPVRIPVENFSEEDAKVYWENIPVCGALNVQDIVTSSMVPADLDSIGDQIRTIRLGCDKAEAEQAIETMTDEANILNRWAIPWGARVQTSIGPFVEIDFFPYGDEVSILMMTTKDHYRWAAFNLRTGRWNFRHVFCNESNSLYDGESELTEQIELAFKLVISSIVRDFVVLEHRESAFAVRQDPFPPAIQRKSADCRPRIVYIPRVRYLQTPDTKQLDSQMDYSTRRSHHVRAHTRKSDAVSPHQRVLAERYGFQLNPGHTFVRPHQRGGIPPEREVIYRSRSAMQSLFGVEASIESNATSNWFRFERDVHEAMKAMGYKVDHVASARNGDDGVDIFAEHLGKNEFWAIQCKCYAPKRLIGPSIVRELIGALAACPEGTKGMLVTTSGYTARAMALANQSNITLKKLVADAVGPGRTVLVPR